PHRQHLLAQPATAGPRGGEPPARGGRAGAAAQRVAGRRRRARRPARRAVAAGRPGFPGLRLPGRHGRDRRARCPVTQRRHLTLVAGGASLLASLPLMSVFERWTWLVDSFLVVGAVVGVAVLVRSFRVPVWLPVLAMWAAFVVMLSWVFSSGHEFLGLIPTGATFRHWNDLLLSAGQDMREFGVPVEDREGLLFLTTLGVGGVALAVDLCTVVVRRPALAGLP